MTEKKSEDIKKEFAREQLKFLKENGISGEPRLSRIFRVAGPGQIQDAYHLAFCRDWALEENWVDKDLLECLLSGYGCVEWDDEHKRMKRILGELNFYVPKTDNAAIFNRIIDGALEILSPGSYDFTEEELEEMEGRIRDRSNGDVEMHRKRE